MEKFDNSRERELLIERALDTLTKNIEFTDQKEPVSLKQRILAASQNPFRREKGEVLVDFNKVEVHGFLGAQTREGSISIKPYLVHKDKEQGAVRMNVQPMSIRLEAIEKAKEERLELVDQIWSGISQEEKMALASNYIDWKKATEEAGLAQIPLLVEQKDYTDEDAKRFGEQHAYYIKILSDLEAAIKEGNFSIEVDDQNASLIFSPKK